MPTPVPTPAPEVLPEDLLLASGLREALRSDDPTALAALVSSLLSLTTRWTTAIDGVHDEFDDFYDDDDDDDDDDEIVIPIEALVESFIEISFAETTAALHVIGALLPDELEAVRVRRALASRRHPMPAHVTGVRDIAVTRAGHLGDDLGDGDNVMLGLDWPGTRGVTAVAYVDEAFGTRIKDVFLVPEPFDDVMDRYRELIAEQGRDPSQVTEVDLADAGASLRLAIDLGEAPDARRVPPDWSGPGDDPLGWPGARPFVEMLLRRMPGGGSPLFTSLGFPELSVAEAVEAFRAAPESHGLHDPAALAAADLIARDAAQWAGHPLRLSPTQVELALTQRFLWAPDATDDALDRVADVLPAYVRFAHARLGIPADATVETLDAVEQWAAAFDVLLTGLPAGGRDTLGPLLAAFESGDYGPLVLHSLARRVGGPDALDRLDTQPLPTEPLILDAVAPDIRGTVTAVAGEIDRWLDGAPAIAHLGDLREEWRTVCRRFLVGAAVRDPGCLRRSASAPGRACGVLWVTGVENDLVGPGGAVLVKDLAADFGISGSPSAKATTMVRAYTDGRWDEGEGLADPGLLVSVRRAEIIEMRDLHQT